MSERRAVDRLRLMVDALCTDQTAGRMPGTPQGEAARNLVEGWFQDAGLQPAGSDGYMQPIPAIGGGNVVGSVPGSGSAANRAILIAAHYDHIGTFGGEVFWGADDNASGVAVLVELAARLNERSLELDRTVVFCSFDAEEPPNFLEPTMGSQWFVDHPSLPIESIDMMVCLDIVGHMLGPVGLPDAVRDSIFVLGAEKSGGTAVLVDALPHRPGIIPRRVGAHVTPPMSDYDAFEKASVPYLFYTCGRTADYHTPEDTPDKLAYSKMSGLVEHLEDLAVDLANRPETRVEYIPEGQDHVATVASLRDLLYPLASASTTAELGLALLNSVEDQMNLNGTLDLSGKEMLAALVLGLEDALAVGAI